MKSIQQLSPFGIVIKGQGELPSMTQLKQLTYAHKLVILRDFKQLTKEKLLAFCQKNTQLLHWDFGPVMEMKVDCEEKNYLFTHGDVPLHWDGAFYQEPQILFFHCQQAPPVGSGGETVFVNTEKVLQRLSDTERAFYASLTLRYQTEKKAHYGGEFQRSLIAKHPVTGKTILKFAEPVDSSYLNPVTVTVIDNHESNEIIAQLTEQCYQPEVMYSHQWQEGDYLLVDNFSLLHGRKPFKQHSPRHLRRLQIMN